MSALMQPIRTYQPTLLVFKTIYTAVHCCTQVGPRSVVSDRHKHLPTVRFSITLASISCSSKRFLKLCVQRTGGNPGGTQHLCRVDILNQAGLAKETILPFRADLCPLCQTAVQFCSCVNCTVNCTCRLLLLLLLGSYKSVHSPLPYIYIYYLYTILRPNIDSFLKTEVFSCFFLS
jgi:hypothetical protein